MDSLKNFFPFVFPFFFIGMWCFIMLLLAQIGGWQLLATTFRAIQPPSGKRYWMQSGQMGRVSYNNCLTIYVSKDGIYLSVWPIFRFGHPPLLIPWSAMHHPTTKKILWIEMLSFEVGSPKLATIKLRKKIFNELKEFPP